MMNSNLGPMSPFMPPFSHSTSVTDGQTGRRRQPCQQLDLYKSTVAKKLSASALCRLADCELTVVDVCSIVMNRCQRDDIVVLA